MALLPYYTLENVTAAYQLNWSVDLFWKSAVADNSWLPYIAAAIRPDGIHLLEHRFLRPDISQFLISTQPHLAPQTFIKIFKGRLQYLLREDHPKAFMRNYCFRSIGSSKRNVVEQYIGHQLGQYFDKAPFNPNALQRLQISNSSCDLSQPRHTSHSVYWYNLHIVLVNDERGCEIRESRLKTIHDTVLKIARLRDYELSRAAILPDHIHLALGCGSEKSPADVALCFLNNLEFALDRDPVFQMGFFAGTFGDYDLGVIYRASNAAQSCAESAE